jgi:hypothetical protein
MKVRDKINILASAIKSRAREYGKSPNELTDREINEFGDAQYREQPDSIAAQFYNMCTDKQWKQVVKAIKHVR